jgi:tripartite ATP-independent transporter DctM subunit
MVIFSLFRLFKSDQLKLTLVACIALAVVALPLVALSPFFLHLGKLNLLIFFLGVSGFSIFAGVPIAFAFGLGTVSYLGLSTHMPLNVVVGRMDEAMSHMVLLAVPLFVLLGLLMEMTGMARAMIAFLSSLLGHVRGGLSYVLVGAMYLVSGISGSKAADMAAIAPALFPEMKKRGTPPGELVALLAATGAQTETIPPSLVLITIGSVTGVSISALFTGGMLPALILGLMLCALVWWRNRNLPLHNATRPAWDQILKSLVLAAPAIALPFVIRAAVVEGVATATEVSTIGLVYSLLCGLLVYHQFDHKRILPMLIDTASLSGAILLIIGAATGMAWALTQSGFSLLITQIMSNLEGGASIFLLVSIVVFVVLGSVL